MNEIRLFVVGSLLDQRAALEVFAVSTVLLALREDGLLFLCLGSDGRDVDRLLGAGIERYHGELTGQQDVLRLDGLALVRSLCDLQRDFHTRTTGGVCDLAGILEVGDLCQGVLDIDTIASGRDCRDSIAGMLVCNDTAYRCVSRDLGRVLPEEAYSKHRGP